MDEVQVEVKPGTYPNLDDIVVEDGPTLLLPCIICNKTFKPEVLQRHSRVCEKNASKKRKTFDSFKQRVKGTELAEFLPFSAHQKRASVSEKIPSPKKTSQWKENHEAFVTAIRAARGDVPSEGGGSGEPRSLLRPPEHERCPYCDRHFGPKAFDRHQEWCREQHSRQPPSVASLQAKERLEARIKYRAPPIRSKRALTREKYSPIVQRKVRQTSPASVVNKSGSSCTSAGSSASRHAMTTSLGRQEPSRKLNKSGNSLSGRTQHKDSSTLDLNRGTLLRTSLRASHRQAQVSASPGKRSSGNSKCSSGRSNSSVSENFPDSECKEDLMVMSLQGKQAASKLQCSRKLKAVENLKSSNQLNASDSVPKVKTEQQCQTVDNDKKENWKNSKSPKTEQVWRHTYIPPPNPPHTVYIPSDSTSSASSRRQFRASNKHFSPRVSSVTAIKKLAEMTVPYSSKKVLHELTLNKNACITSFDENLVKLSENMRLSLCQDDLNGHCMNDLEEFAIQSLDTCSVVSSELGSFNDTCATSSQSADSNRTYITPFSISCDHENKYDQNSTEAAVLQAPNIQHENLYHFPISKRLTKNLVDHGSKEALKLTKFSWKIFKLKCRNSIRRKRKYHFRENPSRGHVHFEKHLCQLISCMPMQTTSSCLFKSYEGFPKLLNNKSVPRYKLNNSKNDCIQHSRNLSLEGAWKKSSLQTTWTEVAKNSGDQSKHFSLNINTSQHSAGELLHFSFGDDVHRYQKNINRSLDASNQDIHLAFRSENSLEMLGFYDPKQAASRSSIFVAETSKPVLEENNTRNSICCVKEQICSNLRTSKEQEVHFQEICNLKFVPERKRERKLSKKWGLQFPTFKHPVSPVHQIMTRNIVNVKLQPLTLSGSRVEEPYDPYASAERQMLELLHSDSAHDINIRSQMSTNQKQSSPAPSLSPAASPKPSPLETSPTSAFTRYTKDSESPPCMMQMEDQTRVSTFFNDQLQVDGSIKLEMSSEVPQSVPTHLTAKNPPEGQPQPPPRSFKRSASLQASKDQSDLVVSGECTHPEVKSFPSVDSVLEDINSGNSNLDNRPRTYDIESGTHLRKGNFGENGWDNNNEAGGSSEARVDAPVVKENANGGKTEILKLDLEHKNRNETRESREIREITEQDGNLSGIDSLLEEVVRMQRSVTMLSELDTPNNKLSSVSPSPQSSARSRRNRTGKMHIEDFLFPAEILEQANENLRSSLDPLRCSSSVFGSTKSRRPLSKSRKLLEHMLFPSPDMDINANTDLSNEDGDVVVSSNACISNFAFPDKSIIPNHPSSPVTLTAKVIDDDDDGLPRPKPVPLSTHSSGAHAFTERSEKEPPLSMPTSPTQPQIRSRQSTGSRFSADSAYSSLNRKSPVIQASRRAPAVPPQEIQQRHAHGNESPQSVLSQSFGQSVALSSSGSESSLPPLTGVQSCKRAQNKQDRDTPSSDIVSATTPLFPKLSKFCHECGTRFSVVAKFCCECGARRLELN